MSGMLAAVGCWVCSTGDEQIDWTGNSYAQNGDLSNLREVFHPRFEISRIPTLYNLTSYSLSSLSVRQNTHHELENGRWEIRQGASRGELEARFIDLSTSSWEGQRSFQAREMGGEYR
jgi:hypothetical protein